MVPCTCYCMFLRSALLRGTHPLVATRWSSCSCSCRRRPFTEIWILDRPRVETWNSVANTCLFFILYNGLYREVVYCVIYGKALLQIQGKLTLDTVRFNSQYCGDFCNVAVVPARCFPGWRHSGLIDYPVLCKHGISKVLVVYRYTWRNLS